MKLPPLVERELRVGSRRAGLFWLRGLLALAAGLKGYDLLDRLVAPPLPNPALAAAAGRAPAITGADLLHELAWLPFVAALLMGLSSAVSINRERREGTLGLLLLTDLTPVQIVSGKMLSCGLTSFVVLLGFLPALMIPVLAGGVSGADAAFTGLGLLNALFVALAAGLWMSAQFRERHHAMLATLGLVAILAFGAEVLGGAFLGNTAAPFLRLFGLAGWMTASRLPLTLVSGVVPMIVLFVFWFVVAHALGWIFLCLAAATLTANWRDAPHAQFREPEPPDEWPERAPPVISSPAPVAVPAAAPALARASWMTDPRPWDADPVRWRVQRMGTAEGLIWLAVAFDFLAQFGALKSIFSDNAAPGDSWGLVSFAGVMGIVCSSGLVAWVAARFFQQTRHQQDLELLLTTPVGSRNILAGQWRVLRQSLKWPLGAVLLLALPAGISLLSDFANGYREDFWFLLHPFLVALNLALEVVALCWVGMQSGLRARSLVAASVRTVIVVQLVPLLLAVVFLGIWASLADRASSAALSMDEMPPVIPALLFFLAKNFALIVWARLRLRRDLRLGIRTARLDASARRLTLQPA